MASISLAPHNTGIYEILNTVNGKRYVGSAVHLARRWAGHQCRLKAGRHHNRHLQAAWNKYGACAFAFRPLLICARDDLLTYEQIALNALQPEFNVERVAGSSIGCARTPETRAKIAAKAKGRKCPPRSAEHRANLSAAQKGKSVSEAHMAAFQAGRSAHKVTNEQRRVLSDSLKRGWEDGTRSRLKSDATKANMSRAFSKLSAEEVREMKRLHAAGTTGVELSALFKTPRSTVSQIIRGLRYRWVTDE